MTSAAVHGLYHLFEGSYQQSELMHEDFWNLSLFCVPTKISSLCLKVQLCEFTNKKYKATYPPVEAELDWLINNMVFFQTAIILKKKRNIFHAHSSLLLWYNCKSLLNISSCWRLRFPTGQSRELLFPCAIFTEVLRPLAGTGLICIKFRLK